MADIHVAGMYTVLLLELWLSMFTKYERYTTVVDDEIDFNLHHNLHTPSIIALIQRLKPHDNYLVQNK